MIPDNPLHRLAQAHGVAISFEDWRQQVRKVEDATLIAVLADLEVDASTPEAIDRSLSLVKDQGLEAPVVLIAGSSAVVEVPMGVLVEVRAEDGARIMLGVAADGTITLPADLPLGYHQLHLSSAARQLSRLLVVTPAAVPTRPELQHGRLWGSATQLYSMPSSRSWGIGDFDDLARLATWTAAEHGAGFVLINPVQAGSVALPFEASPYLPSSRRFTDPIYLAIEKMPEYQALTDAERALVDDHRVLARQGLGELIDRQVIWPAKLAALRVLFAHQQLSREQVQQFRGRRGQALIDFATWCALVGRFGPSWREWPEQFRRTDSPEVRDFAAAESAEIDFWCWVQAACDAQLSQTQTQAQTAGMSLGVMHDLAVGVHPDGADAWALGAVFARGSRVGAPPDAFNQLGQDWGQHPWRPDRLRQADYAPFREMVHSMLTHAGGLRIDHVMGLFRLWWIPGGASPDQGTYVHYDAAMMLGILALEADRAGAVIVGEDLGTVEPQMRDDLAQRGIYGTSILWFEQDWDAGIPLPPQAWRRDCLAAVTTHDLPPTSGYLDGVHVDLRDRLGLLTVPRAQEEATLAADIQRWRRELHAVGLLDDVNADPHTDADATSMIEALHAFLGLTPSRLLLVAVPDLAGERRVQNQPGTSTEYPNWQVPLADATGKAMLLEDLIAAPEANRLAAIMRHAAERRPLGR